MVTTTIALDEKTHYRLRQLALDERTTARDLIRAAPGAALVMRGQGQGKAGSSSVAACGGSRTTTTR